MQKEFDPYYKWLSIPTDEQPPNHYRLLGVPLYTSDPDVIENAADRQMAHIRRLGTGKHAELSQKVLNELSSARVCLLNAEQKAKYDDELRRQIAAATPRPEVVPVARALPLEQAAAPVPKQLKTRGSAHETTSVDASGGGIPFDFASSDARPTALGSTSRAGKVRGRRQNGPSVLLIVALLLAVGGVGFGLWIALRKPIEADPQQNAVAARTNDPEPSSPPGPDMGQILSQPAPKLPTQRTPAAPDSQPFAQPPVGPLSADPSATVESFGENERPGSRDNSAEDSLARSDNPAPSLDKKEAATGESLDGPKVAARKPLPSPADLAAAQARVREVFGIASDEELASRPAQENENDAAEMLVQAKNSTEPVDVRCALLIESLRLSLATRNAELLKAAVDTLELQFETDGWSLVADAAATLPTADDEARKSQAEFFLELSQICQADEAFRTGQRLAEAAQEAVSSKGRRVLDPALRKQASEQIDQLASLADLHDGYQVALETIEKSTDEAELSAAHLAVGQYLVFIREEWPEGCEHLAAGSDARLATAAKADLEGQKPAGADEATAAKKRADLWFDFGQRGKLFMRLPAQRRASHWYTKALPDLKGRDQQNVERRLAELDRDLGPATQLLADLKPIDSWGRADLVGRYEFMYEGEKMPNSLWTNPSGKQASFVTYALDRKFVGLRGVVSIDDSARGKIQSDLIFTIVGDGRLLWRSPPVGQTQLTAPFEVSVKNIQTLTVQCECTGSEGYVHGVWLQPLLLRR